MFNDMRLSSDMMKSFEKFQAKHEVRTCCYLCTLRLTRPCIAIGPGLQCQRAHLDILARRGFSNYLCFPGNIQ
jgi:hypothetical protein